MVNVIAAALPDGNSFLEQITMALNTWNIFIGLDFFLSLLSQLSGNPRRVSVTWTAAHIQHPTVGLCQFIITEIQFSPQEPQLHHHLRGIIVNLLKWEHCARITWWKWNLRHLCKTHVCMQEINGICHLSNGNGPEPRDMMEDPLLLRRCSPKCRAGYKKGESSLLGKWSQETEIRGIRRVKQEKKQEPTYWVLSIPPNLVNCREATSEVST